MESMMLDALKRALTYTSGQTDFANRLNAARAALEPGVKFRPAKQQHVDYWVRVMKKLPERWARSAELAVEGRVTRYELRPDVFGPPPATDGTVRPPLVLAPG